MAEFTLSDIDLNKLRALQMSIANLQGVMGLQLNESAEAAGARKPDDEVTYSVNYQSGEVKVNKVQSDGNQGLVTASA